MGVKPVAVGLSVLLVVGVAIGLIVGSNQDKPETRDGARLSTATKPVKALCEPTDFKDTCVDSLQEIANNDTASPKDFIEVAINVTIDAVRSSIDKAAFIGRAAKEGIDKMAFDDCKELLEYAISELNDAMSSVHNANLQNMKDKANDLNNWLSATVSYQQTCIDQVNQKELQDQLKSGLKNASELTSNILVMVTEFSEIVKKFGAVQGVNNKLDDTQIVRYADHDDDRYPGWVSAADRKLLEVKNLGPIGKPNAVVAKDGSGQFKSINEAVNDIPKNFKDRYIIYVKAGIYDEHVVIKQPNVMMYGDGPRKTIVTGKRCFRDGVTTMDSATFSVVGNGFIGKSMGFQNTAGPDGHQAVALRSQSDLSVFHNCRVDGYQDSLYVHAHRQFYRNCVISGTVDFIFGDSSTIIQNSLLIVRRPNDNQKNAVTAQGKADRREQTAIVLHNCRIVPEQRLFPDRFKIPTFLGRPWKQFSTTIVIESTLADFIQPTGWFPWTGNFALDTLYYAEYGNRGPGANTANRVKWKGYHIIQRNEAMKWTVGPYLQGQTWLPATGTPFILGLKH